MIFKTLSVYGANSFTKVLQKEIDNGWKIYPVQPNVASGTDLNEIEFNMLLYKDSKKKKGI